MNLYRFFGNCFIGLAIVLGLMAVSVGCVERPVDRIMVEGAKVTRVDEFASGTWLTLQSRDSANGTFYHENFYFYYGHNKFNVGDIVALTVVSTNAIKGEVESEKEF